MKSPHTATLPTWMIVLMLAGISAYAVAEDLTLTTYYPSPRGVYKELRASGDVVIGSTASAVSPAPRLHIVRDVTSIQHAFRVDDNGSPDATPFVINSDGNVGIGTSGPAYPLQVVAGGGLWTAVTGEGSLVVNRAGAPPYLQFQGAGGGTSIIYNPGVGATGRDMAFYTQADGGAHSEKVRILGTGQVGIGTTSPAPYLLKVQGTTGLDDIVTLTNADPAKRRITNVLNPPVADSDVVTKAYVDAASGGGVFTVSCGWGNSGGSINPAVSGGTCVPPSCPVGSTLIGYGGCVPTAIVYSANFFVAGHCYNVCK